MINAEYYRIDRHYYLTEILFLLEKKEHFCLGRTFPEGNTHHFTSQTLP